MGHGLGSYENVVQNDKYSLQFVKSLKYALSSVGMKCSSPHTFAPIDSTFCTPGIYI